jgi:hypothetical protein
VPGFLFEEPGIFFTQGLLLEHRFFPEPWWRNLDPQFPDEPEEFVLSKLFHDLVLAEPDLTGLPGGFGCQSQFAVFAADKACALNQILR